MIETDSTEYVTSSVVNNDTTWDFQCPGFEFSRCGGGPDGRPFSSVGWPSREVAEARGEEHLREHNGEGPMSDLGEFRSLYSIGVTSDGKAVKVPSTTNQGEDTTNASSGK